MGLFTMPSLGADMETGTLVEWLVAPGDRIRRGDIIAVVETQKGAIEIECFEVGTVAELSAELGQELPVGAPLALILAEGEAPPRPAEAPDRKPAVATAAEPPAAPKPAPPVAPPPPSPVAATAPPPVAAQAPGAVAASPAARVRARELRVDLASLVGSFPGGRIVLADVEAAGSAKPREPAAASGMAEMRKAIAAAMTRSKQTIPHFYMSQTIDVQPAMDWLTGRNAGKSPADRILFGALLVRAIVRAAAAVKVVNGHYTDGAFHPATQVNAGIAVALRGGGLVAPALIDALGMSTAETMAGMRDLVTRARAGRLRSREMTQGTITISSLGETGAEAMAGVIFPPQVALVGLGAPHVRPWVVKGAVVPRSLVTVTISADHRVSDGRQIAKFIAEIETLIATPETL